MGDYAEHLRDAQRRLDEAQLRFWEHVVVMEAEQITATASSTEGRS